MTDDRFELQVRRHLLAVADERTNEATLAAVLGAVPGARRRPAWEVRARRLASPSPRVLTTLRFLALAAMLTLIAVALVVTYNSGSPRQTSPFEGRWSSIDTADDSAQSLEIGPGSNPSVHFKDFYSIHCDENSDPVFEYVADGLGVVQGATHLLVHYPEGGCSTFRVGAYDVTFDLDVATGMLVDSEGIRWHRAEATP